MAYTVWRGNYCQTGQISVIYGVEFPYRVGSELVCLVLCKILSSTHQSLCALYSRPGAVRRHTADRTPVPEPDTSQTEKAPHLFLQSSDLRTGEALPPTEIPSQRRAGSSGQESEDDRRTGQNLVSEPQDQVEVGMKCYIQICQFCTITPIFHHSPPGTLQSYIQVSLFTHQTFRVTPMTPRVISC